MGAYQEISTGFVARSGNPRIWIARQDEIVGGFHQKNTLEELVNFHPDKMEVGMEIIVNEHSRTGGVVFPATVFKLQSKPTESQYPLKIGPNQVDGNNNEILDGSGNPIPEPLYYQNFWKQIEQLSLLESEYEIEYAPDINGLKPPYPYVDNPSEEAFWSDTYTPGVSKWYRERNNGDTDQGTGIYLNWTVPISINGNFESGDFTQNLFIRAATIPPLPQRYNKNGNLNNEPAGWADVPPVGVDPLYEIRAQKDKYGNLKTDWIGPFLIPEDADLVRYNSQSVPNPNTIAGINDIATTGSQPDLDLIDAGWIETFDPSIHNFRAIREEISPGLYSTWEITKIAEESGEYIDRIYKLYPINTDFDDATFITNETPTGNNPIANQGWSDIPLAETDTLINAFSEARKFIDGSLKTTWTSPRPFTGKDTYTDLIKSDGEISFKYPSSGDQAAGINSDPTEINLTFQLFKGITQVTTGLTYKWFKVYDNKAIIPVDPENDTPLSTNATLTVTPSDVATKAIFRCYATLAVTGGTDLEFQEEESIVDITDGDDAKSITVASETPLIVYDTVGEQFNTDTVLVRARQNFLDGVTFYWYRDIGTSNWQAVSTFKSDSITTFADSATSPGVKTTVTSVGHTLSENEQVNITGTTNYNGNFEITNVTADTFDIEVVFSVDDATGTWDQDFFNTTNQTLTFNTDDLFKQTGDKQTLRLIVTTAADPLDAENADEFYDIITLTKLSSTGTGSPGIDSVAAILSNEVDSVILDRATLLPQAGEIGASGRVKTLIKVYQGTTELDYGTGWTITGIVSDEANITFAHQDAGTNDREVYIDTWTSTTARKVNGQITINVVGLGDVVKNFTVSSNLDDAGALIPYLQVSAGSANQSLSFNSTNTSDIQLQAVLDQNGTNIPAAQFDGNVIWKFGNSTVVGTGTNDELKNVARGDVSGSLSVYAQITYNGNVYTTTPVSIDDITDGSIYILYHVYNPVPAEPLTRPTKPANSTVDTFTSDYAASGTTDNTWYREPSNTLSYYYSIGTVQQGSNIIVFSTPVRYRGEKGVGIDGDPGDKGWSAKLSLLPRNGGAEQVLRLFWVGGAGTKPADDGKYLGPSGTFVTDINNAVNVKGDGGATSQYVKVNQQNQLASETYSANYTPYNSGNEITIINYLFTNPFAQSIRFKVRGLIALANASGQTSDIEVKLIDDAAPNKPLDRRFVKVVDRPTTGPPEFVEVDWVETLTASAQVRFKLIIKVEAGSQAIQATDGFLEIYSIGPQ